MSHLWPAAGHRNPGHRNLGHPTASRRGLTGAAGIAGSGVEFALVTLERG